MSVVGEAPPNGRSTVSVLHVIDSDGPGGAESILVTLVEHALLDGERAAVIAPGTGPWITEALARRGVAVRSVPTSWPAVRAFDWPYLNGLRRALTELRPSLVHAHSHGVGFYVALALLLVRSRAPLLVTLHGTTDLAKHRRFQWAKWILLRRAQALVCVSESLAQLARVTPGVIASRVSCIHNGIDTQYFSPHPSTATQKSQRVRAAGVIIGAVGNVRAAKGYDVLLRAVALCVSEGLSIRLLIAGDDLNPLGDELRMLGRELAIESQIEFVGFVSDVATFLNGLDLLVVSSHTEGFSLAAAQAQACGLPVISTRCGGPEEIVADGETGILVPVADSGELCRAIRTLAASPETRSSMGERARLRVMERFSSKSMIDGYRRLYGQMLAHDSRFEEGE